MQSRSEHGTFQPYIVPFNNSPHFFLWDKGYGDRVALVRDGSSTIWAVPAETRNVAISNDDKRLVLLTVKEPAAANLIGRCKYTLQWTHIFPDSEAKLTIESEYKKHQFGFRGTRQRFEASLVIFEDLGSSIALIAFSNGFVEQVQLT